MPPSSSHKYSFNYFQIADFCGLQKYIKDDALKFSCEGLFLTQVSAVDGLWGGALVGGAVTRPENIMTREEKQAKARKWGQQNTAHQKSLRFFLNKKELIDCFSQSLRLIIERLLGNQDNKMFSPLTQLQLLFVDSCRFKGQKRSETAECSEFIQLFILALQFAICKKLIWTATTATPAWRGVSALHQYLQSPEEHS